MTLGEGTESWDDLLAGPQVGEPSVAGDLPVRDRAGGCPYAALSGDAPREAEPIKAAFAQELENSLDSLARRLPGRNGRRRAIVSTALMVGALMLARSATDPRLRDEILEAARRELLAG